MRLSGCSRTSTKRLNAPQMPFEEDGTRDQGGRVAVVFRCSAGRKERVPGSDLRYRWAVPVSRNLGLARSVTCAGELHGVSAAAIPTYVLGATDWLYYFPPSRSWAGLVPRRVDSAWVISRM
jgi:hypothetical protein